MKIMICLTDHIPHQHLLSTITIIRSDLIQYFYIVFQFELIWLNLASLIVNFKNPKVSTTICINIKLPNHCLMCTSLFETPSMLLSYMNDLVMASRAGSGGLLKKN